MSQDRKDNGKEGKNENGKEKKEINKSSPNINIEALEEDYLKEFICPLTFQIMNDPVTTETGHTYERVAIERWLKSHNTNPMTNQKISGRLIPNRSLKNAMSYIQLKTLIEKN